MEENRLRTIYVALDANHLGRLKKSKKVPNLIGTFQSLRVQVLLILFCFELIVMTADVLAVGPYKTEVLLTGRNVWRGIDDYPYDLG